MIDNGTYVIRKDFTEHFLAHDHFQIGDFHFEPCYYQKKRDTIKYFESASKGMNMNLRIFRDKLVIENSIHKFYEGTNHTDFDIEQIQAAFLMLSERLGLDITTAEVKKFEFGMNVILPAPIVDWSLIGSHMGVQFLPMASTKGKTRIYGMKAYHDEYSLKIYDKSFDVNQDINVKEPIDQAIVRIEISVKSLRWMKVPIKRCKDLWNHSYLQELGLVLVKQLQFALFHERLSYIGLSRMQIRTVALFSNPHALIAYRKLAGTELTGWRLEYERLCAIQHGLKSQLMTLLSEKQMQLLHEASELVV